MIRVLHIFSPTFGRTFSGDSKLWVRLFQKWKDEQVNHQVAFAEQGVIVDAKTIKSAFGQKDQVAAFAFPRWRRALWAFKLLWFLSLKRRRYDIIHIHTDLWGALLAGPLGRVLGRPCICHIVRMGEDDPTTLVRQSLGSIKLWCFKRYRRIVCISEALKQECLRQGLGEGKSIMLINSVGINLFSPGGSGYELLSTRIKLNLPEHGRIVLSVGSVILRKGTDLLVEAFCSLAGNYPDVCLVLVGPASKEESAGVDESFVAGLRRRIAEAGLAKRVIFTGRIDEDITLADYYRTADIFAFPTRQEGLGNVLLEAMSAGLPVVATHLVGITDMLVKDGETGFLIPPENVPSLKEKLQWMLDHPEQRRELGWAAREYAVRNFGFNAWQERLVEIYISLVNTEQP
jgi:glycosyltransferase involved in cell wall biosynthesis